MLSDTPSTGRRIIRERAFSNGSSSMLDLADAIEVDVAIDNITQRIPLATLEAKIGENKIKKLEISNESDEARIRIITRKLSQVFTKGSSIQTFAFDKCTFNGESAEIIAAELPNYKTLQSIRFDGTFGNNEAKLLCNALAQLPSLTKVELWAAFSDEGINALLSLMEKKPLTYVGVRYAQVLSEETYQRFCSVMKYNATIEYLDFMEFNGLTQEWIADCFSVNTTLTTIGTCKNETWEWFVQLNQICKNMKVPKVLRDQVPKDLKTKLDIESFVSKLMKKNSKSLEYLQEADGQFHELSNKIWEIEGQFAKFKLASKKVMAKYLVGKAQELVDKTQLNEAKCVLQIALELNQDERPLESEEKEEEVSEYVTKEGNELMTQIEDQLLYSDDQRQEQIETKISSIEKEIAHAEQQVTKAKSEEETNMIRKQMEVMVKEMEHMKQQMGAYESRHKELQEREAQVEQHRQLLREQTKQFAEMIAKIATTPTDVAALSQHVSGISSGDKDIDSARRRLLGVQKSAQEAQQKVKEEERKQRERVELLQKQMEFYKQKGMSPAQKTYKNFLKEVKRLSLVRSHMERFPNPFRCFISYAWETDQNANTELQDRLQKLKDDLEGAGIEVTLDLRDMKGDMKSFMKKGISRAHMVLLICTPRLKERAADKTTNLYFELVTALKKEKSNPGFILPLVLSGSFRESMPPQVSHLLSLELTPQADYFARLAGLAPMGLIPMMLGLERNKDYKKIHDRFFADMKECAAHV